MNNNYAKQRIKPTLLREIKTEALLVFIRTTLEDYFLNLKNNEIHFKLGSKEDNDILKKELKFLLMNLQLYVVNSTYLRNIISKASVNKILQVKAKNEESLMVYYDVLVKKIESSLKQGEKWIPEQLVLCLLSEWVLEEEKSTKLYSFLKKVDYSSLLNRYDLIRIQAKKDEDREKVHSIMNMYKVANDLIRSLKNCTYKINTKRVSKKRKKKNK